jgi:hypothetical protein
VRRGGGGEGMRGRIGRIGRRGGGGDEETYIKDTALLTNTMPTAYI